MGASSDRKSEFIEHYNHEWFKDELIATLQLVRSALFYFIEMVTIKEHQEKGGDGFLMPLTVPSHHYIRGEPD